MSDDSDIDEDEAARRYNRKHETKLDLLKQSFLDRVRKGTSGAANDGGYTLKDMLESQMHDGYGHDGPDSDDYDMNEVQ